MSINQNNTDAALAALIKMAEATKKRPPVLDINTRRLLHKHGWTTIRSTALTRARQCDFQQLLAVDEDQKEEVYNIFMVLGIVGHEATIVEYNSLVQFGDIEDFWIDVYRKWVREERERLRMDGKTLTIVSGGQQLSNTQVEGIIRKMAQPLFSGQTLKDLIVRTMEPLWMAGHKAVDVEYHMYFIDGVDDNYPIRFQGQYDAVTTLGGRNFLWDLKFWGIFGTFVEGKARIAKTTLDTDDIRLSFQHQHYAWLMNRLGMPAPDYYGYLVPTNLVPYKNNGKGYKKGDNRGPSMFYADVPGEQYTRRWERFLVDFLSTWARKQTRRFPSFRGENLCKSCQYRTACLGASDAYLMRSSKQFDFMRE